MILPVAVLEIVSPPSHIDPPQPLVPERFWPPLENNDRPFRRATA
jgi:hypothetical protein